MWTGPVLRNERLMVLLQVWERARTEGAKRESLFLQRHNKTTCSCNIIIATDTDTHTYTHRHTHTYIFTHTHRIEREPFDMY